jgi:next-to-BRCA1 protein 1
MATPAPTHLGPEHPVTVKVLYNDSNRRFKLPLKDLKAQVFPRMLRTLLGVPADVNVILERYSDSAGSYVRLDCDNLAVYKQLYRAAKAKSKLRIKVSTLDTLDTSPPPVPSEPTMEFNQPRHSYLETVLSPAASPPAPTMPTEAATNYVQETNYVHEMKQSFGQPRYRNFELEADKHTFPVISHNSPNGMFCIDCNKCGRSIANGHYHCSICENGDYDLCPQCVTAGATCGGDGHWLIKRIVKDGAVTNSTTEIIPPRGPSVEPPIQVKREVITKPVVHVPESVQEFIPEPAAASPGLDAAVEGEDKPICNGCCREADESNLVRCNDCEDYDLCLRCLLRDKHGHHPGHTFHLGSDRNFCLKNLITSRCLPGRQFRHAAVCDGCDKRIVGVRHKCLACPDWDLCPECIVGASESHPHHRFVPIYDTIGEAAREHEVHYGIFCDGPLCRNKPAQSYIHGIRYKCAVCDDTDFCASCEALPTDHHNRTHPLVKFKTPVRSVTVSTMGDDGSNRAVALGDQPPLTISPQTATDEKETVEEESSVTEMATDEEKGPVEVESPSPVNVEPSVAPTFKAEDTEEVEYKAYFISDTVTDGTKMAPDTMFRQTWTLHNPGPTAWPAGCDVRFVGGDTMFNVDSNHPSSVESIRSAMESNKLSAPVEAGGNADFTVNLRTPSREGTAISYWRLKLPNGLAIGHRLWCDVEVHAVAEVDSPTQPEEANGSAMIFPKLEKESPTSSTLQFESPAPQAPTLSNSSECDVLDGVESLSLDTETDAGFLTDEEYDVLDASDQEFLDAKQSAY